MGPRTSPQAGIVHRTAGTCTGLTSQLKANHLITLMEACTDHVKT